MSNSMMPGAAPAVSCSGGFLGAAIHSKPIHPGERMSILHLSHPLRASVPVATIIPVNGVVHIHVRPLSSTELTLHMSAALAAGASAHVGFI
jgi:hypothetical protein